MEGCDEREKKDREEVVEDLEIKRNWMAAIFPSGLVAEVSRRKQRVKVTEMMNSQILAEAAVLAKSSSQPKSTYEAAASLSEFELMKILMDKMEENKSHLRADYKRELYDALVKSYNEDFKCFLPCKISSNDLIRTSSNKYRHRPVRILTSLKNFLFVELTFLDIKFPAW
ncbi:hypothetical protein Tco_0943111 [Tanacetum coccineum]